MRSKTWGLWTTGFAFSVCLGVVLAQSDETITVEFGPAVDPVAAETFSEGMNVPIPAGAVFRQYLVGVGEVSASVASDSTGTVVYSNLLGNGIFLPGGPPGLLVGDDIATIATKNCVLDSVRFRVSGDPLGDGSGVGPFSVTFAFYNGCPSAGGAPLFTPITQAFPDNGNHEVIYKPAPESIVSIPTNAYFGIRFSRSLAGIVSGAPATVGFSGDRYDFPGARCDTSFGGFPGSDHASFELEIRARNDCPEGICKNSCVGGSNNGESCVRDDCPFGTCAQDIVCVGGLDNASSCAADADCRNACVGGLLPAPGEDPVICNNDGDCANACRGGSLPNTLCEVDGDCLGGGTCSIGVCPLSACSGDRCVGGPDSGDACSVDDCPSGSCDGAKSCDGGSSNNETCEFDCVPSFPAYKNTGQGGSMFTSQPSNLFFAEDIRLAIPVDNAHPCDMVSWEVGFKGSGILTAGAVQAELHTFIDNADPEGGGRIPGTKVTDVISGSSIRILKKTFSTPIPLTQQELFVVFKTQNNFVGAIRTCKDSAPGSTEDIYFVHSGSQNGSWSARSFFAGCTGAFEVTISCAGAPPSGACCDMQLTEGRTCVGGTRDRQPCNRNGQCRVCIGGVRDGFGCDQNADCPGGGICPAENESFCIGDAVCRQLPEMNCAFPILWREGETCGAACDGGARDGEACVSPFDCPPACVGGVNDGEQCFDSTECPGACETGSRIGQACATDLDCPDIQFGTPTPCVDPGTCGDPGACRGEFCVGGDNHGESCSRAVDCPGGECGSSCMGGELDGFPCVRGSQCPGGFCPATPFPEPCGLGTCCTRNDLRCCATERDCHTEGNPCGVAEEPIETPVLYNRVQACDQGGCPRGACISREGDCTQAHDGLCVGGTLDGDVCPFGTPCIPGLNDCCAGVNAGIGVCEGSPGCEAVSCCSAVCALDGRCCNEHWSESCAAFAFQATQCQAVPSNDRCFDEGATKGAMSVPVNSNVEVDLINANGGTSQPELCCFRSEVPGGPGPGTRANATVWLKTIGPDSGHLLVHTCSTTGGGGDDSIVQVFSVGDKDSGLCEDRSACSVRLRNCFDGSTCELSEQTACSSLSPIGCSDDSAFEGTSCINSGGTNFFFNSKICVDVVPGDPYYILVGAKDFEARGKYRVTTSEFCAPSPPVLFNDLCDSAPTLGVGDFRCDETGSCNVFYDLTGLSSSSAPATFDCPAPDCLLTMENDVWYDWIAPATGRLSVETCDGAGTPDTSLAVYNGCDCPADATNELACSETSLDGDCFLGSRLSTPVEGGKCYKIRLGGNLGGVPSGPLTIGFDDCPNGPILGVDPPNQTIDARAPLDPNTGEPRGMDSFTVQWPDLPDGSPGGTVDRACYTYCETNVDGFDANDIFGVVTDNGGGSYTIRLKRPIAPGAWGKLTAKHGDLSNSSVVVVSLPTDVDSSQGTNMGDLDALMSALNNPAIPFDKYRHDMDHSGALTPQDLLRWLDMASGVPGAFDTPWLNVPISNCFPCCPG